MTMGSKWRQGNILTGPEVRCGEQVFPSDFRQRDFCTPQFATLWIIEGSGVFTDERGRDWPLQAGDCVHRFPDQRHHLYSQCAIRSQFVALPGPSRAACALLDLPGIGEAVCRPGVHADLIQRHQELAAELPATPPHRLAAMAVRLQQWVVDLHLRVLDADDPTSRAIEAACARLDADHQRALRMPDLAAEVGMRYATFRARFKAHTGMSPGAYRIRRMIDRAQHLLRTTDDDCGAIAEQLGYPDLYTFSSQFKRVTGLAPSYWRQMGG